MDIKKIEVEGDTIFLKKSVLFGWGVVEPIFHPETGKFLWRNFFNKKGFVVLAFVLLLLLFSYLAFQEQIENYDRVMKDPCPYCEDCQEQTRNVIKGMNIYPTKTLNISFGS